MTERKLIEILILENQIEANRMKDTLEERKIPFVLKEYTDLEYGNVKGKRGWGRLESYKEFEQEILQLYREGFVTPPFNDEGLPGNSDHDKDNERSGISPIKKTNVKEIVIILLLLSTCFLAYKVYDLNRIINRPSIDKNFKLVHGSHFFLKQWKSSGKDYYLAEDQNGTGLFNKHSLYDPKGILSFIALDDNGDGIREKTIFFDTNKDTLDISYDQNEDGIGDKNNLRFNKNFNLIFQDFNFDRKYDSVFVNHKSYSIEQFLAIFK
jgi:hypothetical protein